LIGINIPPINQKGNNGKKRWKDNPATYGMSGKKHTQKSKEKK
jgi:hypothetical protein